MPTTGQLALLSFAIVIFAVGGMASVARVWWEHGALKRVMEGSLVSGLAASAGVLMWHSWQEGQWVPIGNNFNALLWLAVLLGLFVAYVQWTSPIAGLDWFIMPVVILLLLGAGYFGRTEYHPYVEDTWSWVHRAGAYGGAAAFAVAAAGGAMYVLVSGRLRRKGPLGAQMGNLERLEGLTMTAATLGFALLTIGLVTGVVRIVAEGRQTVMLKIVLASAVWIVYGLVLHAPINPSIRGRKVALLSMFGFVLMVGAIIAAQFA